LPLLLPIHIAAAGIGLVSGAVALTTAKGRTVHRKSGIVFVYSMVAMCASALVAAAARGQTANVLAALMTSYLVITGLMTVRPPAAWSRRRDVGLMCAALALGVFAMASGIRRRRESYPQGVRPSVPSIFPVRRAGAVGRLRRFEDAAL
jgi:uncharacterized membrane protein